MDRGFAAVDTALYGRSDGAPKTPFFRFPGFASSPALLDWLQQRGILVFGTDLWASDWSPMSPEQQLALVLGRVEANRGGIVLFHDTSGKPPPCCRRSCGRSRAAATRSCMSFPPPEPRLRPRADRVELSHCPSSLGVGTRDKSTNGPGAVPGTVSLLSQPDY